ncbi:MAG: hypothetical protein R3B54_06385 [Bdellovibrionota bacterium]
MNHGLLLAVAGCSIALFISRSVDLSDGIQLTSEYVCFTLLTSAAKLALVMKRATNMVNA